jgi:repressor LexA
MAMTPRQAEILAYIAEYTAENGYAPTLQEIGRRFSLSSVATVHKHVSRLIEKGYLRRGRKNASRDLEVVARERSGGGHRIPLLGTVAAGRPIAALVDTEEIELPDSWLGRGRTYALRVSGDSMIGEQIRDGDVLVVEEREVARNGETVIALIDGEAATVKQYQRHGGLIHLVPANPQVETLAVPEQRVRIQGVVTGVLRRY